MNTRMKPELPGLIGWPVVPPKPKSPRLPGTRSRWLIQVLYRFTTETAEAPWVENTSPLTRRIVPGRIRRKRPHDDQLAGLLTTFFQHLDLDT